MAQLTTNHRESLQEILDKSDEIMQSENTRTPSDAELQIVSALIDDRDVEKAKRICHVAFGDKQPVVD